MYDLAELEIPGEDSIQFNTQNVRLLHVVNPVKIL